MQDGLRDYLRDLLIDVAATDTSIVLLAILLVTAVIVLDAVSKFAQEKRRHAGFDDASRRAEVRDRNSLPVRRYISDMQRLSGTPDALISENGHIIPVERKPFAKKIRDRYVAQLLVYMRLVEEFEGKKPPYGYLVLGPSCRKVKIDNSPERQAWLQKIIDEMQAVLQKQTEVVAAPEPRKCTKCSVRLSCSYVAQAPNGAQRAMGSASCVSDKPRKDSISEIIPKSSSDQVQGSGRIAATLSSSKPQE